jgi:hypothetical protein
MNMVNGGDHRTILPTGVHDLLFMRGGQPFEVGARTWKGPQQRGKNTHMLPCVWC